MEWLHKDLPEMSADFCNRVIAASRDVQQYRPLTPRTLWERATNALPMNPRWAIATMVLVFAIGLVVGIEVDVTDGISGIAEIMEI